MVDFYVYLEYLKIFWQILNFVFLSLVLWIWGWLQMANLQNKGLKEQTCRKPFKGSAVCYPPEN